MKKIFTFIFAAALAVSCWGTEVTVPSTTSATTTSFPFCLTSYGTITQQLYLASEIGAKNIGELQAISFYYSAGGNTSSPAIIYIKETSETTLGNSFVDPGTFSKSSTVTMNKNNWFTFSDLAYNWSGGNLLITIIDNNTENRPTSFSTNNCKGYQLSSNRGLYKAYESYATVPTGSSIVGVSGTSSQTIAQAKFLFEASETPHTHDNLTFTKWTSTNSLPADAGNYFLESNVTMSSTWTVSNAINLCLNGKTINLGSNNISVSGTLNIYDCQETGTITSYKNNMFGGTIKVDGGIVGLYGGEIINTSLESYAYDIYQNGTLKLGGSADITSPKANIQLGTEKFVTIESGLQQPTSPISIYRLSGVLTSGWANMGDANPADYFISANSSYSIAKNATSGELELASAVTINETSTNNPIQSGSTANVTLIRTLVKDTYNTICLPFAVSAEQIAEQFGANTEVQDLTNATLSSNDMDLTLEFTAKTAMEAGKPYLIKPTSVKDSYTFNNVTLTNSVTAVHYDYVDFVGTFNQQASLPVVDKNILLMGTGNTLFWATNDGGFKGLRAYFKITYHGASAPANVNARMTFNNVTKMQEINQAASCSKMIIDGQLIINRNGVLYNASGQMIK